MYLAEIIVQDDGDERPYRARTRQPIEIDYHDGLGRFGIEAVAEDGRRIVLYLSVLEACGISAALRSEIGRVADVATDDRSGTIWGRR